MTFLPVAVEPVKASLSTPALHSAAPVAPRAGDDLEDVGHRQRLGRQLDDLDADQGRQLAGLEHDRVAGGQGVGDRAHGREDRVVPRADHADHAERMVGDRGAEVGEHAGADLLGGQGLGRAPGRVVEVRQRHHDLDQGVEARLAILAVDQLGQLVGGVGQRPAPAHQLDLALGEGQRAPGGGGGASAADRGGDAGRRHHRHLAEERAVGGGAHLQALGGRRRRRAVRGRRRDGGDHGRTLPAPRGLVTAGLRPARDRSGRAARRPVGRRRSSDR
jgi:hypothetical protein